MPLLYIGLMSGTSRDGADAVLGRLEGDRFRLLHALCHPMPAPLRGELLALDDGATTPEQIGHLETRLGRWFAEAARRLLEESGVRREAIRAIGCHGQTVRHRPDDPLAPFTLQLGDPSILAEETGITTVADFRRRDLAAGGQGAPLVPAFHAALFHDSREERAVLNLGGIGNLTLLPPRGAVTGFDTGPANCLLDAWARRHLHAPMDRDGAWAAGGEPSAPLLERLLAEPWFATSPPRSTGPDHFSPGWLERRLRGEAPQTVQATLLALTVESIAQALARHAPACQRLLVCGGGLHNRALMEALERRLAPLPIHSTAEYGLDPDWVEAAAFAWLAHRTLQGLPGNLPEVTGAAGPRVLGAIYPA